MKKILIFARDPGEVNVLFPLIENLNNYYQTEIFATNRALRKFSDYGFVAKDLRFYASKNINSLIEFLKKTAPDFVLTGSGGDFWEKYLWKSAKQLFIPTLAIIDNWINLGIRFSKYSLNEKELFDKDPSIDFLPDKICVIDDFAKKRIIKEGVPLNKIFVSGNPYFDFLKTFKEKNNLKKYDKKIKKIIFASEPLSENYGEKQSLELFGHTELTVLKTLITSLNKFENESFELILRPHPNENLEKFKSIFSFPNFELKIDTKTPSLELISSSNLVCGMSSMFLIESLAMKIPIISLLLNLKQKSIFILEEIGKFHSLRTEKQLDLTLNNFFNLSLDSVKIDGFFKNGAINNIINLVRSML